MKFRLVETIKHIDINDINNLTLYRGTNVKTDKFTDYSEENYKTIDSSFGPGIYLCTDKDYAKTHGKYLYTVKIHCKNPLIYNGPTCLKDYYENPKFFNTPLTKDNLSERCYMVSKIAYDNGYDCIVFINEHHMKENEIMVVALYNNILEITNIENNISTKPTIVGIPGAK